MFFQNVLIKNVSLSCRSGEVFHLKLGLVKTDSDFIVRSMKTGLGK